MYQKNSTVVTTALLSTLCAIGWGLIFPLTRAIVTVYPPLTSVSLRFLIVTLAVLPFLRPAKGQLLKLFGISLLMMTVPFAGLSIGMVYMDSGIVSLFLQLEPLILILFGALLFKEKLHFRHLGGLAIALSGVYFVVHSPEINLGHPIGLISTLIAVVSYCVGAVLLRYITLSSKQIMMWSMALALPQIILVATLAEGNPLPVYAAMPWWVYGLSVVIGAISLSANGMYSYLLKKHSFSEVAPFMMLVPVFTVIFG